MTVRPHLSLFKLGAVGGQWRLVKQHRHAKRARVIFLCDRRIRRTVYSNDLVKFLGCDVQHERNWEFMMYIRCYIGNGKIAK